MRQRFTKFVAAGVALTFAATALPVVSPAEAGHRGWHGGGYHHYHHRHRDHGGAAAAGIFGLAAGALLGSALAQPRYYAPPPPPPVYYPAPVTYAPAPWTADWYAYCASKYRSFDAGSGTYVTYSGVRRVCQ